MSKHALIIGANSEIAQSLTDSLLDDDEFTSVYTVSRASISSRHPKHIHRSMDTSNIVEIESFLSMLSSSGIKLHFVVCATGVLHQSNTLDIKPEKRLEDINREQLAEYFSVNTILPALWLRCLIGSIAKQGAKLIFFSARVGSISDNKLGGWYGYRASKAALNMVIKCGAIEYQRRAPNTILVCYHPGTVDTKLSKPFQANVKPEKLFSAEFTCQQLLSITRSLEPKPEPYYLDWDGNEIPW